MGFPAVAADRAQLPVGDRQLVGERSGRRAPANELPTDTAAPQGGRSPKKAGGGLALWFVAVSWKLDSGGLHEFSRMNGDILREKSVPRARNFALPQTT